MLKNRLEIVINTLGLKKKDFSKRIGFTQSYISMLLSGTKKNPSEHFYESIKREFNFSIDWLRDGLGEMFVMNNPELSSVEKTLISKYNLLPLSQRYIVDEIVDALLLKYNKNADQLDKDAK